MFVQEFNFWAEIAKTVGRVPPFPSITRIYIKKKEKQNVICMHQAEIRSLQR